jgi:hypothetical protein
LAQAVLHDGIDKQALVNRYGKAIKWLAAHNRFGRMVFGISPDPYVSELKEAFLLLKIEVIA